MIIRSRRGRKKSRRGVAVLCLVLLGVAGGVGGTFFYKEEITALVHKVISRQEKGAEKEKKGRGTIYDRSFKELALSLDRVSVYVRPREMEDVPDSAAQLATALGMNEQELLERLDGDGQWVWLAKDISLEEENAVSALHLPGVYLHREQVRSYPNKNIAAHVIGFADNNMGLAGAEYYYNRLLDQTSISQNDFPHVDLQGRHRTGISGQHLVLTIDLKIQDILEKYVTALSGAHAGAEIASLLMETGTGAIVASAHFPSFDPNAYYQYSKKSLANILLEPMVIPAEIQAFFQNAGSLQIAAEEGGEVYPWSIAAATGAAGSDRRLREQSGLTTLTELDFTAGNGGGDIVAPEPLPENSAPGVAAAPMKATPMQILLGVNFLMNGGHRVLPHVLDRVLERNGDHEYSFRMPVQSKADAPLSSPVLAETWRLLQAQGHKGVLDSVFFDVKGLSYQPVLNKGGEYLRKRMMLAVLPQENPELILMVLMRQPYLEPSTAAVKDGPGLAVAAEKILPSIMALQQVNKNLSDMMKMSERKESNYRQQEKKKLARLETILKEEHPLMPDLSGMSLRKALRLLQDKNVRVRIEGTGRVAAQSPAAGVVLGEVKECRLTLKKDEKVELKVSAKAPAVRARKTEEGRRPAIKK